MNVMDSVIDFIVNDENVPAMLLGALALGVLVRLAVWVDEWLS